MSIEKTYYVYIMSNNRRTVLYVGMTNNLERRFVEHTSQKEKVHFTKKYNVDELVYYETYDDVLDAIAREKQLKSWRREKKIWLIQKINLDMENLYKNDGTMY